MQSNLWLLSCGNNNFTHLDLSNNNLLGYLNVSDADNITELDLSELTELVSFQGFWMDQLIHLNIRNENNTNIFRFDTNNSPNLVCIEVDDPDYSNSNPSWIKDATAIYSEDCSLSLEDFEKISITVYPNPVRNVVNIDSEAILVGDISILDMQGRIVKKLDASDIVEVSQLTAGLYFLKIASEGAVITTKFIKK
jgi:hypothetical protein